MKPHQTDQKIIIRSLEDINAGFVRMNNNFDKLIDCAGRNLEASEASKSNFASYTTLQTIISHCQANQKAVQKDGAR